MPVVSGRAGRLVIEQQSGDHTLPVEGSQVRAEFVFEVTDQGIEERGALALALDVATQLFVPNLPPEVQFDGGVVVLADRDRLFAQLYRHEVAKLARHEHMEGPGLCVRDDPAQQGLSIEGRVAGQAGNAINESTGQRRLGDVLWIEDGTIEIWVDHKPNRSAPRIDSYLDGSFCIGDGAKRAVRVDLLLRREEDALPQHRSGTQVGAKDGLQMPGRTYAPRSEHSPPVVAGRG